MTIIYMSGRASRRWARPSSSPTHPPDPPRAPASRARLHPGEAPRPSREFVDLVSGTFDPEMYVANGERMQRIVERWLRVGPGARVLDWGCGPGRVAQFWPRDVRVTGIDINPETLGWARENFPWIRFSRCGLRPPTELEESSFDFVYGFSVITHLYPETVKLWSAELHRLLAPGGAAALTFHGDAYYEKFTRDRDDVTVYETGYGVVGRGVEGSNQFGSFHHVDALMALLPGFTLLEHLRRTELCGNQDAVILRRA